MNDEEKLYKLLNLLERLDDNLAADLEHGVAWLNDQASTEFAQKYPRLLSSIVEVRKYVDDNYAA